MRSFYEMEPSAASPAPTGTDRITRLFLQLAVLAFWTPCTAIDLYLLWRGGGRDGSGSFVFWLLFRQALIFLSLWFTVAITQGLLVGRRTPSEARRRRRHPTDPDSIRTAESAAVTLTRNR